MSVTALSLWLHLVAVTVVALSLGLHFGGCHCGGTLTVAALHSGSPSWVDAALTVPLTVLLLWLQLTVSDCGGTLGCVPQPGLTGPSWQCASARPHRTQLVVCLSQAAPDPAGFASGTVREL